MGVALEKEALLRGPLVWSPNLDQEDPEVKESEQRFNEVVSPYVGSMVLVQGIDRNDRLMTRYPERGRLFILQQGILKFAERRELDRGGHYFLGFSDGNTAAIGGYGWAGYHRILDFVGSEISRVVGPKGEIIYSNPEEAEKWDQFYKKWRHNGEIPDKHSEGISTIGDLSDLTSNQIFQREIQKALSENLLAAYRVQVE